ncbi:MAG: beta-propeller domain-containing protein [Actinobacteria bacterium]|nr:beta-propeller domain-containing protein [Actinomycetota bacterium]MCG2819491.1 beta-propeller domain-containing protein [Actinomycetes bacterium]MBU4218402.1 beta-propeller domain-containing protein [Actinomycetota bacterium]MBU4358754.1 beta-propeller domain-containing protein [Actinomycetota bacterium]MBU4391016.1 beta-propeller domain-containing protein [Actinomycetota bacterium]
MKRPILILIIIVLVSGACSGAIVLFKVYANTDTLPLKALGRFESPEAFIDAFKSGREICGGFEENMLSYTPADGASKSESGIEHSTTNVQVSGVDEADIVKNDGEFIYTISNNSVVILAAYPPGEARVISTIKFDEYCSPAEMFLKGDRLVVIGSVYGTHIDYAQDVRPPEGNVTFVKVFDVKDKEDPRLVRTVEYEGSYSTSRRIEDDVHVVLTTYPYYVHRKNVQPEDIIPDFRDVEPGDGQEEFTPVCDWRDVEYTNAERCSSFLTVLSLSMDGNAGDLGKRVIAGQSEDVYASPENLYVASTDWSYPQHEEFFEGPTESSTTVYKFGFDGASTRFLVAAAVPGTVLNQFSMDEADGYFRIATTRGHLSRGGSDSSNNVYILDPDMKMTGRLEGLAPGESIYSARFMGDRAYLVTFKKVDPLFVLDLSDPASPRVLGALKIPGYSDYLHPYDENHIIGLGKDAVAAESAEGDFAWYQGIKMAIFDVTDVANPREMYKTAIGDRGTDSYALHDHKAFLFDREKNLLVLPVLLAELTPEQKTSPDRQDNDYGEPTFQGAYVYDVSLGGGFNLKGRITHAGSASELAETDYYYGSSEAVKRSLYIGDSLYTVSDAKVKINRLPDLSEEASISMY